MHGYMAGDWHPVRRQDGFTLVELLVVILIIGILAAVAIPSIVGQRERAQDARAKHDAHTAYAALEAYRLTAPDYNATPAELVAIEPALGDATNLAITGTATTFVLSVDSSAGHTFTVELTATGVQRTCTPAGRGGCPASASW